MNMLAELSTKEISEVTDPETFNDHINMAQQGGKLPIMLVWNWKRKPARM